MMRKDASILRKLVTCRLYITNHKKGIELGMFVWNVVKSLLDSSSQKMIFLHVLMAVRQMMNNLKPDLVKCHDLNYILWVKSRKPYSAKNVTSVILKDNYHIFKKPYGTSTIDH